MNAQLKKLAARYDALQERERWLVAAAVLGGILMVGYTLFVEPARKTAAISEKNATEYKAQLSGLQSQLAVLQSPERNPDTAAKAELEALKKQLAELGSRMQTLESTLVPPQRMTGLLEEMIGRRTGLRLVSLKTLTVSPLLDKKDAGDSPAEKSALASGGLYKHGVEIRLEGSYQELAAYLERLEQSKLKLLWSGVSLSAEKHPKLILALTVYTLSLDRTWLIV